MKKYEIFIQGFESENNKIKNFRVKNNLQRSSGDHQSIAIAINLVVGPL